MTFDLRLAGDRLPNLEFAANLNDSGLLPGRRIEYRANDSARPRTGGKLDVTRSFGDTGHHHHPRRPADQSRGRDYDRRDLTLLNGIVGVRFPLSFFNPFPVRGFLNSAGGDLPRDPGCSRVRTCSWAPRPTCSSSSAAPLARGRPAQFL